MKIYPIDRELYLNSFNCFFSHPIVSRCTMKLTLLCKGDGYYFPPCYMLDFCGLHILLECPLDLSALKLFSPIPYTCFQVQDHEEKETEEPKRRKIEREIDAKDLIHAQPWFKTVTNLHLWDLSFIDIVLISSPMSILGLPFLTRNKNFSGEVYATEAASRIGKLMMEDLVSMHMEFTQFYGSEESWFPKWMKWDELEFLPGTLKEILSGEDGAMLGCWQPLYNIEDVKDCVGKIKTMKYAEEACYNDMLILKPVSSGLEIGACNWVIDGIKGSIAYVTSSIFSSGHAMSFDYCSLCGNDTILFSDFSSFNMVVGVSDDESVGDISQENRDTLLWDEHAESSEEKDKIAFICSCVVDSLGLGGSVLVPSGRIGVVLQLLEQISTSLDASELDVPIFMISTVAEELLAYLNILPEWLCENCQENLYRGDSLFGHVELVKKERLQFFPAMHSIDFVMKWQEPCIVFAPHWSLRLGPVVHLLHRWSGDPNSLLVLEQEVDADLGLLPYKPVEMKVLQCSFLTGIQTKEIQPLLKFLRPKLVLFPEDLRANLILPSESSSYSVFHYSENQTLHIASTRKDFDINLATDLAFQLRPIMMKEENLAVAKLEGKLIINHGKFLLDSVKEPYNNSSARQIPPQEEALHENRLLSALQERNINASLNLEEDKTWKIRVHEPMKASIEVHAAHTIISAEDNALASTLFEVVSGLSDDKWKLL